MRIGLIARADNTGLGVQSKGFFDHITCKALVIDFSNMVPNGSYKQTLVPHLERFPGQQVFKWGNVHNVRGDMPKEVIAEFIKDIDILFAMETPYDYNIFEMCRAKGVKVVLQPNYEFLDFPSRLPMPDLFAAPSLWNFDLFPSPKTFLPVPVNLSHFKHTPKEKTFVHVIGRTAHQDRNGTLQFLTALNYVKSDINVIIRGQLQNQTVHNRLPSNINLKIEFENKLNYADNYDGGVLVMPRKYGGLCLPINEALAAGMPVIATNVAPNNYWLPEEWLVASTYRGMFKSKRNIDYYEADAISLAEKIDEFCQPDFYRKAVGKALGLGESISWGALYPQYINTFQEILR
jgi:glycosyltransferase involved in cell wall biosynthesis